jgi:phosphoribosylglycinamide formyltransferase-1
MNEDTALYDSKFTIGVLASGRGTNLEAIINAIETGVLTARIGVVISDKKDAKALARAREHNLPAFFVDPKGYPDREAYDAAVALHLTEHQAQLVICAGFMRLLTSPILERFQNRIINIHPSLLPAFPGLHAQRQALEYGAKVSGCTVHFVDAAVDHGPIISQVSVPILEGDTEESLTNRILIEEHRILPRVIQLYVEGKLSLEGRKVLLG